MKALLMLITLGLVTFMIILPRVRRRKQEKELENEKAESCPDEIENNDQ